MADSAISTPGIHLQDGEASIATHAQLANILRDVAQEFGATVEQLRGPQRRFVPARKEFCRRAWEFGRWSSVQIGRVLNRDHSVVLRHVSSGV